MITMQTLTDFTPIFHTEEIEDLRFEDIDFGGGSLCNKYFLSCTFSRCDFSQADLSRNVFRNCRFEHCDLSLTRLDDSSMDDVLLADCRLTGIDWTLLKWRKPNARRKRRFPLAFRRCALSYGVFAGMELYEAVFEDCLLKETVFEDADLEGATFGGCDLTGAVFLHTNLQKADLSTACNYLINAAENSIRQARFSLPEAMSLLYAMDIRLNE